MIRSVYTSPDQVVVTFAAERGASFLYSSLMITATEAERLADLLRSAASYAKGGDGR